MAIRPSLSKLDDSSVGVSPQEQPPPQVNQSISLQSYNTLRLSIASSLGSPLFTSETVTSNWLAKQRTLAQNILEALDVNDPTTFENIWSTIDGVPIEKRGELLIGTKPFIKQALGERTVNTVWPKLNCNIAQKIFLLLKGGKIINEGKGDPKSGKGPKRSILGKDRSGVDDFVYDHDLIVEFGGGGVFLAQTLLNYFIPSGKKTLYVIFDLPILSHLQRYALSILGFEIYVIDKGDEVASIQRWLNSKAQGPSVLLLTDFNDLDIACQSWRKLNVKGKSLFMSFWALSETPIDTRYRVLSILAKSYFDDVYVTYQRAFENVDNRRFFAIEMVDFMEDFGGDQVEWVSGRMNFGMQHYVDGDMFMVGRRRRSPAVDGRYAAFASYCSRDERRGGDIGVGNIGRFSVENFPSHEQADTVAVQIGMAYNLYCDQQKGVVDPQPFRFRLSTQGVDLALWEAATNIDPEIMQEHNDVWVTDDMNEAKGEL
ncbi:hypothetical protein TrLO_g7469 [Triparma laevis f. longispina]|uniref:Uncharacterized protein n=1 Tax=Triparma laevis f. longispina TaxID=1714387 RepID=A0A9W6ZCZ8_9STRA|nr:hypothetical protein TrLO_g7469 [Triparma laevis f. longispina]